MTKINCDKQEVQITITGNEAKRMEALLMKSIKANRLALLKNSGTTQDKILLQEAMAAKKNLLRKLRQVLKNFEDFGTDEAVDCLNLEE